MLAVLLLSCGCSRGVEWDAPIDWKGWGDGLAQAKARSQPMFVFVYADW